MSGNGNKGKGRAFAFLMEHVHDLDEGACLIWPFFRDPDGGYGRLQHLGESHYAHRLMCRLANGPPPSDIHEASHSCGQGHAGCIHPKHLDWKTPSGNHLDRRRHGTHVTSVWGNHGKLTEIDRQQIIKLKDYLTQREIGKLFGVPFQTVSRIHLAKPKVYKIHFFTDADDRYLIEGDRKGLTIEEMADDLGLTFGSAAGRINRLRRARRIPARQVS